MIEKDDLRAVYLKRKYCGNGLRILHNIDIILAKHKPKIVGIYRAFKNEVDILNIVQSNDDIEFALPEMPNNNMVFTSLNTEKYSIPELVLVPGVAFDVFGYRLGRGMAAYDKYFTNYPSIIKVGICYKDILIETLPREAHDIKMDYIITDEVLICQIS